MALNQWIFLMCCGSNQCLVAFLYTINIQKIKLSILLTGGECQWILINLSIQIYFTILIIIICDR